jgi:hypothetical protein
MKKRVKRDKTIHTVNEQSLSKAISAYNFFKEKNYFY